VTVGIINNTSGFEGVPGAFQIRPQVHAGNTAVARCWMSGGAWWGRVVGAAPCATRPAGGVLAADELVRRTSGAVVQVRVF